MQVRSSDLMMQEVAEEMRSYKVVKSNDMIQKSRFHLSAQEQKIVLYLISRIKPEDKNFEWQEFNIADFCRVCGIDSTSGKNYKDVREIIRTIGDKSTWIMCENGIERLFRWITYAEIHHNSGLIKVRMQDDMKPFLLDLHERFTQYELIYTIVMKSQYSIRMYELLKSYEYRGRYKVDMDELKAMLFATKYKRFPDFKRKVLDVALREINTLTDLTITYTIIKVGRRYGQIEFDVSIKKDPTEKMTAWKEREKALNYKDSDDYTYGHKR